MTALRTEQLTSSGSLLASYYLSHCFVATSWKAVSAHIPLRRQVVADTSSGGKYISFCYSTFYNTLGHLLAMCQMDKIVV